MKKNHTITNRWKTLQTQKIIKYLLFSIFLFSITSFVTENAATKELPNVTVINLNGKPINTKDFVKNGKPVYIAFWATWCVNCFKELKAINEQYDIWQKKTGVTVYAISIDDKRTQSRIGPIVKKKNWKFKVSIDVDKKLSNILGVKTPPHSFIVNGKGEIIYQHTGYKPGDEQKAFEVLKSIKK